MVNRGMVLLYNFYCFEERFLVKHKAAIVYFIFTLIGSIGI